MTYSNSRVRALRKGIYAAAALAITVAIVACGGSYGGAGSMPTPRTSSVAVGVITGFGSVHLNGLKFETTSATINVDGKAGVQSDLHAGEVIEVKGHHDAPAAKISRTRSSSAATSRDP